MFKLFRSHNLSHFDGDELIWSLTTDPRDFANEFLKQTNCHRRNGMLECVKSHSMLLTAFCIEINYATETTKINHQALIEVLCSTEYSKQLADFSAALGLLDETLAPSPSNVSHLRSIIDCLFASNQTLSNESIIYNCKMDPSLTDEINFQESLMLLDSFERINSDCRFYANIFQSQTASIEDKILTAAKVCLILHGDKTIRGAERANDVGPWIDYGLTDVDRELILAWMLRCDPFMRAGYQFLVTEALKDPSERGKNAQEILDIIQMSVKISLTKTDVYKFSMSELVENSLHGFGLALSVPAYVINNKLIGFDLKEDPSVANFIELQMHEMKHAQKVLDIIFRHNYLVRIISETSQYEDISHDELELLNKILPRCMVELFTTSTVYGSIRRALSAALKINDEKARISALTFIDKPATTSFENLCENSLAKECAGVALSFLNSKICIEVYKWLEKNLDEAIPEAKEFLCVRGVKDEATAIYCLSLISQKKSSDSLFSDYVEKLFQIEKRPLVQLHLLRALGQVQGEKASAPTLDIFDKARRYDHLRIEATNGLASSGTEGLMLLKRELESEKYEIHSDSHGRRTPLLSIRQQEIIHALPGGAENGAQILREFLKKFPNCIVTHLIADFLKNSKQKYFGMNEEKLKDVFNAYCDRS